MAAVVIGALVLRVCYRAAKVLAAGLAAAPAFLAHCVGSIGVDEFARGISIVEPKTGVRDTDRRLVAFAHAERCNRTSRVRCCSDPRHRLSRLASGRFLPTIGTSFPVYLRHAPQRGIGTPRRPQLLRSGKVIAACGLRSRAASTPEVAAASFPGSSQVDAR
jgi:hypothetical protein